MAEGILGLPSSSLILFMITLNPYLLFTLLPYFLHLHDIVALDPYHDRMELRAMEHTL